MGWVAEAMDGLRAVSGAGKGPVLGCHGAVSAGDPFAATVATEVLASGGTAVDAVLAGAMVQCVVEPAWCGLGGDAFALVFEPGEGVVALNGSGAAPVKAGSATAGLERVPRFGPLSVAVPGFVGAWDALFSRFASLARAELVEPARRYALRGFPLDLGTAAAVERAVTDAASGAAPGLETLLAGNGRCPGELFRQPELAWTLGEVAERGAAAFYEGAIAERVASWIERRGGPLSLEDLGSHETAFVDVVSVRYRDRLVVSNPPVSLGILLLEELALAGEFDVAELRARTSDLIDLLVWCKRESFRDLALVASDPPASARFGGLDPATIAARAATYETGAGAVAVMEPELSEGTDTTSLVAVDARGQVAVVIHSLFNEWGAREVVPGTGVLLNDRLAGLRTDASAPNGLRPGCRPVHTLNAYMVLEADNVVLAGATPGGRGQVQTNFQVLTQVIDFGSDIQSALEHPRWLSGTPRTPVPDDRLLVESEMGAAVIDELRELGHDVVVVDGSSDRASNDLFGGCTVVAADPAKGVYQAAADPRRRVTALAW